MYAYLWLKTITLYVIKGRASRIFSYSSKCEHASQIPMLIRNLHVLTRFTKNSFLRIHDKKIQQLSKKKNHSNKTLYK